MADRLIDLDHLALYVGDDLQLRREILLIYRDQLLALNERILAHRDDQQLSAWSADSWYETMHTLKGASRGVGVWTLGNLGEAGERFADEASAQSCPGRREIVTRFLESVDRVVAELDAVIEDRSAA